MRNADRNGCVARGRPTVLVTCLALAILSISCASSNAPRSWLPPPADVPSSPLGAWIEVLIVEARAEGTKERKVRLWSEGEFLAVGADSVHVLTARGVESIPLSHVHHARVALYQSQTGKGALVTAAGVLSTASNGVVLILTAPVWIIAGSVTAGAVSREPLHDVPSKSWREVSIYARFPQGLPADFDAAGIRFDPRIQPRAGP